MIRFIEQLWRDLDHGARMLLKRPGFTFAAIFSLVRGVRLRPLPFSEPERLIGIRESKVGEGHNNPMAWRSFAEFRDKAQTLEFIAAYRHSSPDIEHGDGVVSVQGAMVSHNYFRVFGVHPLLGRDFAPEDNQRDAPQI